MDLCSLTLVFKKIAHSCPSREDELGHILDDFGFFFRRKCSEPFGETLFSPFN